MDTKSFIAKNEYSSKRSAYIYKQYYLSSMDKSTVLFNSVEVSKRFFFQLS